VDGIFLALPCALIGALLFEPLTHLGSLGPLLGFLIALPYFTHFNSNRGGGQTPGKRGLGIRIVDANGNFLSVQKAALRYTIWFLPVTLGSMALSITKSPWIISFLISVISLGIVGSTLYLLFFNRHTRQTVHDLAVGSYVIDAVHEGPVHLQPIWKPHRIIIGLFIVALICAEVLLEPKLKKSETFAHMFQDIKLIEEIPGVQTAGIQEMRNLTDPGDQRSLIVNVVWTGDSANQEILADRIAGIVLENDPTTDNDKMLSIVIVRGYDLGFWRYQSSQSFVHSPAEWDSMLP
jgi:uncharacterized RDD family membrane protein YckC